MFQIKHPSSVIQREIKWRYPINSLTTIRKCTTLLKMQPHDTQSTRENVTPSSGTSLLAPYKEYPQGGGQVMLFLTLENTIKGICCACFCKTEILISFCWVRDDPDLIISCHLQPGMNKD